MYLGMLNVVLNVSWIEVISLCLPMNVFKDCWMLKADTSRLLLASIFANMSHVLHLKSCSFASLGKCFLETNNKDKTIRIVSGEEIEPLSLHLKLAPADIYDICSHHKKGIFTITPPCSEDVEMHLTCMKTPEKNALREIIMELRGNAFKFGCLLCQEISCVQCAGYTCRNCYQ